MLRKRDAFILNATSRVWKTTHKYGVEMPTNIENAKKLDSNNGNDFWVQAIKKGMHDAWISFEIIDDGISMHIGHKKVTCYLVFDVKMEFTRKARWALDRHKTPAPEVSACTSVVSRESARIAFAHTALNGLDVFAANIRNAHHRAPTSEKYCIICGLEFGLENAGKRAIIRRALYGGEAAGRDFRNHLRSCVSHLDFKFCLVEPDALSTAEIRALCWMVPAQLLAAALNHYSQERIKGANATTL